MPSVCLHSLMWEDTGGGGGLGVALQPKWWPILLFSTLLYRILDSLAAHRYLTL